MIFPLLKGFISYKAAPVTWMIICVNFFVMMFSSFSSFSDGEEFMGLVKDKSFIELQGSVYQSYLRQQSSHHLKRGLASLVEKDSVESHQVLGVLAFRDKAFLESTEADNAFADEVGYEHWRKRADQFLESQRFSLSHALGVSAFNNGLSSWISYMFAHGSWFHFASNMIFLLIVGGALEALLGGAGLLLIYLLSGLIACGVFILMSGLSASPLIGASGAVSALISLFAVLHWNKGVRYFYWLFTPRLDALGQIYLPGGLILFLWLAADLAGFLSSSSYLGGVAHSAHLGGHLAGVLAGITFLILNYKKPLSSPLENQEEMYQLKPFFK